MDQPFSRVADALLDRQFWSPEDPQKQPYDDTGWSFGDLFNAKVSRVTDRASFRRRCLQSPTSARSRRPTPAPDLIYVVNNSAQVSLASLVYALSGSADVSICEEGFESEGQKFGPGSLDHRAARRLPN